MSSSQFGEGGRNVLPLIEVTLVTEEPRRREPRDPFATLPCFIDADGWHRIEVFLDDIENPLRHPYAADVNDCGVQGLSVQSEMHLKRGQQIEVAVSNSVRQEEVVRERFTVCSKRAVRQKILRCGISAEAEYTFGVLVEESMEDGLYEEVTAHTYGLKLNQSSTSLLYKSYLDSVFLAFLREEANVDIDSVLTALAALPDD